MPGSEKAFSGNPVTGQQADFNHSFATFGIEDDVGLRG